MANAPTPHKLTGDELFAVALDKDLDLFLSIDSVVVWCVLAGIVLLMAARVFRLWPRRWQRFEIDQAELGLKGQKITLRPNDTDRQIAYKIWVELSTRKIGLPIDLDDDVISEVYDSWYDFFAVTRGLIKDVPVSRFQRKDTEKIVRLSIEVLNYGIRPHLTKWQARFRRWYETRLADEKRLDAAPQDLQQEFPQYDALTEDLHQVNQRLIRYREKMYELVTNL